MIRLSDYETETALPSEMQTPERAALAYAFDRQKKKFLQQIRNAYIWADLKCVDDSKLDFLATESRIAFYNSEIEPDAKRNMIQNAIYWHMKFGTRQAMEEMVDIAFGSKNATVESWHEYGGEPYRFRVVTGIEIDQKDIDYFLEYVKTIKNARSRLDSMVYSFAIDHSMLEKLFFISLHYHMGIPFFKYRAFDGSWLFDGSVLMDAARSYNLALGIKYGAWGIRERERANLVSVGFAADVQNGVTLALWMENHFQVNFWDLRLFDGSWLFDGSVLMDAARRYGLALGIRHGPRKIFTSADMDLAKIRFSTGIWSLETVSPSIEANFQMCFFNVRYFDGSWPFDGSVLFDAGIRYGLIMGNGFLFTADSSGTETIGEMTVETKTADYWLFDGSILMDGSRGFNSKYKKEVVS